MFVTVWLPYIHEKQPFVAYLDNLGAKRRMKQVICEHTMGVLAANKLSGLAGWCHEYHLLLLICLRYTI